MCFYGSIYYKQFFLFDLYQIPSLYPKIGNTFQGKQKFLSSCIYQVQIKLLTMHYANQFYRSCAKITSFNVE